MFIDPLKIQRERTPFDDDDRTTSSEIQTSSKSVETLVARRGVGATQSKHLERPSGWEVAEEGSKLVRVAAAWMAAGESVCLETARGAFASSSVSGNFVHCLSRSSVDHVLHVRGTCRWWPLRDLWLIRTCMCTMFTIDDVVLFV